MTKESIYEVPDWNHIYGIVLRQAQKILNQPYKPDIIIGIANGGLIPARILTDLLECPKLTLIQIEFYSDIGQTKQEPLLKKSLTTNIVDKRVLLVDDIADTGKSLQLAKEYIHKQGAIEIKTAALYFKPHSATVPDFYEKQTNSWVVFPWEIKETLRKIVKKQSNESQMNSEIMKLIEAGLPRQLVDTFIKST